MTERGKLEFVVGLFVDGVSVDGATVIGVEVVGFNDGRSFIKREST